MKGSLRNASQSFICRCCKAHRPITDGLNTDLHLDIGNGVSLEKVDKFCYLGAMLDVVVVVAVVVVVVLLYVSDARSPRSPGLRAVKLHCALS